MPSHCKLTATTPAIAKRFIHDMQPLASQAKLLTPFHHICCPADPSSLKDSDAHNLSLIMSQPATARSVPHCMHVQLAASMNPHTHCRQLL
eukprot:scaffold54488_cov17-Tisochrysis_lutea.AAC.1